MAAAGYVALTHFAGVLIDLGSAGEGFRPTGHDVLHGLRRGGVGGWALAGIEGGDAAAGTGADVDEAAAIA